MATVPVSLLGRDLTSCTVYGGNAAAATGIITWATGVDLSLGSGNGAYKGFTLSPSSQGADVTPSDGTVTTNLPDIENIGFSISEIQNGNGLSALEAIYAAYDFIKVVMTYRKRGSSGAVTYRAVMGRRASISLPHDTGMNVVTVTADSIGYTAYIGASPLPGTFS